MKRSFINNWCIFVGFTVSVLFSVSISHAQTFEQELEYGARTLTSYGIHANGSTKSTLRFSRVDLFLDNDMAFERKLEAIRGAKDTTIRMAYYIYADDYSSSVLTNELIKAANERNVRVKLLVDLHSSYKDLDLFAYMSHATGNRIEVRFYNRPTRTIMEHVAYITLACPTVAKRGDLFGSNCKAERKAELARLVGSSKGKHFVTPASSLFLSGLYAKNPELLGMGILQGREITIDQVRAQLASSQQGDGGLTDEQKEGMKMIARLYWRATIRHELSAKLQLFLLNIVAPAEIGPMINMLDNLLPVSITDNSKAGREWRHFTDYLHHKLLLVGQKSMQFGGRNVEDSYHMRPNPLVHKYVFMDTDVYGEFSQDEEGAEIAADVANTFNRLWGFREMVIPLEEIFDLMPNDMLVNLQRANEMCADNEDGQAACVQQVVTTDFQDRSVRMSAVAKNISDKVAIYQTGYLDGREGLDRSAYGRTHSPYAVVKGTLAGKQIGTNAMFSYVENLPFVHRSRRPAYDRERNPARALDPLSGEERESSKFIHEMWVRGLENVCARSFLDGKERWVVLHNAYVLLPSNLSQTIANMVNGRYWNCQNVHIAFVTNSIGTTDLNVINPIARMAMHALFAVAAHEPHTFRAPAEGRRAAKLHIYEYKNPESVNQASLHSKISILGDDVLVGSANADVRSFRMDTNNGIYIRYADEFVKNYLNVFHAEREKADTNAEDAILVNVTGDYEALARIPAELAGLKGAYLYDNAQVIVDQSVEFMQEAVIDRWNLEKKFGAEGVATLIGHYKDLMGKAYRLMIETNACYPKPWDDDHQLEHKAWFYEAIGKKAPSSSQDEIQAGWYEKHRGHPGRLFDNIFQTL